MEFNYIVNTRRSHRDFQKNHAVDKHQIEEMIKAAQKAPSWKNSQTARFYAVMTPEVVESMKAECLPDFNRKSCEGAPVLIVTTFVRTRSGFTRQGVPEDNLGDGWGCFDLGLQVQNLLLKATELGLGTLVMGIRDSNAIRRKLQIPEQQEIAAVIAVGYAKDEPQMPKRKEIKDILSFI